MFVVVYQWRLRPGYSQQFMDGWERVTRAIQNSCGSYGSRLHRIDDDTWLAYARWPSAAARSGCDFDEEEGTRLMRDAIQERLPEIACEIVSDLLCEPAG
jgi:hypothetical protein